MFKELKEFNTRPAPFQFYTADELWANEHTAKQMLEYHLNETIDVSSRNKDFIERSVEWIVSHFGIDKNTEIADFGCGPGLYTTRLAEQNAIATGIDFSENSPKYAKQVDAQKEFEENGFKVEELYSDVAGKTFTPESPEIAIVAKKS